jgi:hypothetical protein
MRFGQKRGEPLSEAEKKELEELGRRLQTIHEERMAKHPRPELAIAALQVEYNSLRQESLAAIAHRIQIVGFVFAAISIATSAVVANVDDTGAAIFCLSVPPFIAFAASLVWLGEYQRSQRAGRGMMEVERSMNLVLDETSEVVLWETSLARRSANYPVHVRHATDAEHERIEELRKRKTRASRGAHMSYPYKAALYLMVGPAFVSQLAGVALVVAVSEERSVEVGAAVAAIVLDAVFLRAWLSRWRIAFHHDMDSREVRSLPTAESEAPTHALEPATEV